ncbi:MAG: hypothetical protein EBV05_14035, partial [Cyanobacteria bacterium WB6_1B_304]|nr:hypothetical protein [Cyanobacteria bacterium WB6_1B_304]
PESAGTAGLADPALAEPVHLPPAALGGIVVLVFAFFSIAPRPGPPIRWTATAAVRGGGGWWVCGAGASRCWSGPAAERTARETERDVPGWKDREPSVGSGAGASGIPPPPPPSGRIEELAAGATLVLSGDEIVGKAGGKTSTAGGPLSSILGLSVEALASFSRVLRVRERATRGVHGDGRASVRRERDDTPLKEGKPPGDG